MRLNRRVKRLEAAAVVPGTAIPKNAACVVIYSGRDDQGQPIPKDDASRAAAQRTTGAIFFIPDNGR